MRRYRVRNWEQFQHYKDRNPPWIKLHFALLASEDWVMLADASKLLAVVCMLVASRNEGCVPDNPAYLRRIAYLDDTPDLKPLVECGFLEIMQADGSAVQADASAPQANARPETEERQSRGETEPDTEPKGSAVPAQIVPIDARTALFREGVEIVRTMTGRPENACRSLIGCWLKEASDDASIVMMKLQDAKADNRADLAAWMAAALKPQRPDWRQLPEYRGCI